MKKFRIFVLILLVAIATPFALHRRAWALHRAADGTQPTRIPGVHIVSPEPNESIGQAYIVTQYQQTSSEPGTPIYELQLDGRDPIQTADTNYTFNGLKPGSHHFVVQVVDGNGTPVTGTRSEVNFTVTPSAAAAGTVAPGGASNLSPLPQPLANDLPNGNGSLPLLSIIGFGILVGGVISALRTRPAHK